MVLQLWVLAYPAEELASPGQFSAEQGLLAAVPLPLVPSGVVPSLLAPHCSHGISSAGGPHPQYTCSSVRPILRPPAVSYRLLSGTPGLYQIRRLPGLFLLHLQQPAGYPFLQARQSFVPYCLQLPGFPRQQVRLQSHIGWNRHHKFSLLF